MSDFENLDAKIARWPVSDGEDDALYDTVREYEEMDVGEPSTEDRVEVLVDRIYKAGATEDYEEANCAENELLALIAPQPSVGGLESWMVTWLNRRDDGDRAYLPEKLMDEPEFRLDGKIATAIERILREAKNE